MLDGEGFEPSKVIDQVRCPTDGQGRSEMATDDEELTNQ